MSHIDPHALAASELRYAILARLALGKTTLHGLLSDLARAVEEGVIPGGFTIADVVSELKLYQKLGIVVEVGQELHLRENSLPEKVWDRILSIAARMTRILASQHTSSALQANVAVEA